MEDLIRVVAALVVGGAIGLEREYRDKAAGFRTIILITVGATIFTIFSLRLGGDEDPVRIAAGIVSGVGFLGAGVILRHRGEIVGITTAATIWLAAGLGMGIGSGNYATSATAATAVLIILWLFPTIEYRIDRAKETHSYQINTSIGSSVRSDLKVVLDQHGLSLYDEKMGKLGDTLLLHWKVSGPHAGHEAFALSMLDAPDILEFDY